jgi:beta-glucosidase
VIANLVEAHAVAARALRETDRIDADGDGAAVLAGAAKHWVLLEPRSRWSPLDRFAAGVQHRVFNEAVVRALAGGPIEFVTPGAKPVRRIVESLKGSSDFLGVNYYTRWMVALLGGAPRSARRGAETNDLGWEIYPEGLERALRESAAFGLPMLVTENGIADAADRWRPDFIRKSLSAVDRARDSGLDLRGYFHWSLMDNFEWMDGYDGRFGLHAVDFDHPEARRRPRTSARLYAEQVALRKLHPPAGPGQSRK